jgi:MoaA/NifB/PqqE/SkfB family radical SAM enzyme
MEEAHPMIDVAFYIRGREIKNQFLHNEGWRWRGIAQEAFEKIRSRAPIVFNIETTNACSMTCPFCPRTKLMTRPVKTMAPEVFKQIADQLHPHPPELWQEWLTFAQEYYGVPLDEQSENAFFLYILPKVITLHGYGDPLLDPHIADYVGILTRACIPSYFSCNPANIQLNKISRLLSGGLSYIKFSIDSVTDPIRGRDDISQDLQNVFNVIDIRDRYNYPTEIIITMIDTGRDEFELLKGMLGVAKRKVYIYQKSLDQAWMTGGEPPKSIHWREYCQMPWSSMTINSSGLAVACQEDFDGEIVLGDAKIQTLKEIWNGAEYDKLRRTHIENTPGIRCTDGRCDMRVIGRYL